MIIENSPVGSSKVNGILERAIQSVQGMIRTKRSAILDKWVAHSVWPWIATAYDRMKGKSAEVQGLSFAKRSLWKRRRAGCPLGKLTCMWEDGVRLRIKTSTEEVVVENRGGVWLTKTVRMKTARERWDRSSLEMIVAVPRRKRKDDAKMDGERLKGEVVMMDKDYMEQLEMEEHVPVPRECA